MCWNWNICQGAKKVIFKACHLGKLKLEYTTPNVISTNPKTFWWAELIAQFFCNLDFSKNFTCLSGKLRTKFTGPIAKSTSPWLSDTTFFAHCICTQVSQGVGGGGGVCMTAPRDQSLSFRPWRGEDSQTLWYLGPSFEHVFSHLDLQIKWQLYLRPIHYFHHCHSIHVVVTNLEILIAKHMQLLVSWIE